MEGETFINRINMETERIVQEIELDTSDNDSYIKHIANLIPRRNVKINEHMIDVFITIILSLPIYIYLYPGRFSPFV